MTGDENWPSGRSRFCESDRKRAVTPDDEHEGGDRHEDSDGGEDEQE
ncbi:hypothetical protein ACFQL4_08935 [Halosimplex aquaticum]